MRRRALFVQYTDPASYPPVEHSTRILADGNWDVLVLGTGTFKPTAMDLPAHPNVTVKRMGFQNPGWRQKLHYLRFCAWAWYRILRWRPHWVYASDALSCAAVLAAGWRGGARLLYHEHDAPAGLAGQASMYVRVMRRLRRLICARANLIVVPNAGRAALLPEGCGGSDRVRVVRNCPSIKEVRPRSATAPSEELRVLYHGSLVPERLPFSVLQAMAVLPPCVKLTVVGFETTGAVGYMDRFTREAMRLGLVERLSYSGAVPRDRLFSMAAACDVGLAVVPMNSDDPNLGTMAGASNKAFEYLACGLAVIVSDLPDWRPMYVEAGYAIACDPSRPDSVAAALRWCLENRELMREMGARGRARIEEDWNYEAQFAPVLRDMLGPASQVIS